MEWIDVNKELPENGIQVLTLVEGYFPSSNDMLCQKKSYWIFVSTFHRSTGWDTPFSPKGCRITFWMKKPVFPV
jgi:hypothetical protein